VNGIAGLLAFIAVTAGLLRRLWRMPARGPGLLLGRDVFPALLTMQLVWFITWQPGWSRDSSSASPWPWQSRSGVVCPS
jgi:hypothetical protein